MLSTLKLHQKNKFLAGLLAVTILTFLCPAWANAATRKHVSHRTQLGRDLDGDHIPESATIRQSGFIYQISIHFTTGRPRLRLTTYLAEAVTDVSIETSDLDNDRRADLVITSATSLRPLAVWLNLGKARFKKVSSLDYGRLGSYTGPKMQHRVTFEPDPVVNISGDPMPDTTPDANKVDVDLVPQNGAFASTERPPSESVLRQIPARGPPLSRN